MDHLINYLPIFVLALTAIILLFATAADVKQQFAGIADSFNRLRRSLQVNSKRNKKRFSLQRILLWLIFLFLLLYLLAYQRVQDAIAVQLVERDIKEVVVGSLIIPYSAFFQSAYLADVGFSRSKKRIRTAVSIKGNMWSGFDVHIDEIGMANINKITGKKFVFSYLTDVNILRPAINRHMDQLVRGKQIDQYEIETFDNRGPYIIVALSEKNRGKDSKTVATALAKGLHTNLTTANQLKVNQVIIKVVDYDAYIADKTIKVIGRGKAGNY